MLWLRPTPLECFLFYNEFYVCFLCRRLISSEISYCSCSMKGWRSLWQTEKLLFAVVHVSCFNMHFLKVVPWAVLVIESVGFPWCIFRGCTCSVAITNKMCMSFIDGKIVWKLISTTLEKKIMLWQILIMMWKLKLWD